MATSDDLERQLDSWLAPTLHALGDKERKKLMSEIGLELAKSNRERIKAQREPDGTPFKPRKEKKPINKPVKFLYEKPGGIKRMAAMRSFRDEGDRMIGYDREAGGIRTFLKRRIEYYTRPDFAGGGGGRLRAQRGKVRRQAMFRKISRAQNLRMLHAGPDGLAVGFVRGVAGIAAVHQYGEKISMEHHGAMADYPKRELIGLSQADIQMIQDKVIDHITNVKR
ncbi:phage virion morphogenesis protein [Halomonas sp.]|uniref:phage virion morphogenesis protein n=1 Tax=Halomonas sp. TaxID=1486246 RepID=UPI003D143C68